MKNKKYTNEQICQAIQKWLGILQDQLAADNQANGVANEAISLKDLKSSKPVNKLRKLYNGVFPQKAFRGDTSNLKTIFDLFYEYELPSAVVLNIDYDTKFSRQELEKFLDTKAQRWHFAYKILTMNSKSTRLPCILVIKSPSRQDLFNFIVDDYAKDDRRSIEEIN